jgi:hypothetical protein
LKIYLPFLIFILFQKASFSQQEFVENIAINKLIEIANDDYFFDSSKIIIENEVKTFDGDRLDLCGCIQNGENKLHKLENYSDCYISISEKDSVLYRLNNIERLPKPKDAFSKYNILVSVYSPMITEKTEKVVIIECLKRQGNYKISQTYYFFFSNKGDLYDWCFMPLIKKE